VQRDVGGNLAEVLETTVTTRRERSSLRRHVRALSAEGRLSAYVLLAMPFALAAFMFFLRREYLRPLYTHPIGLMMLAGGSVLVVAGAFWMSRMVKIKV
jgi:Flp pilus assembly protein TadB